MARTFPVIVEQDESGYFIVLKGGERRVDLLVETTIQGVDRLRENTELPLEKIEELKKSLERT
ncbi:hypothetical protein [Thermicanus aegyptius]|uniref:hypothetical protein n=1 Tax=Thermicanus aegyptius TaxID=94009 RepID=UPI00048AEF3E|nr:hypothetical protein [Thermicanus aegyptius]